MSRHSTVIPATSPSAVAAPRTAAVFRSDIQGLRALAVSLVFAYHLAPGVVPGGFVGVDVFFVISGFLITSHLLARPPRRPRDLLTFWSRRARRLLPASFLVLGATLVASRLVAPETQWENTARQAGGATVYVINWMLAANAVDYLAAENAPSPVQHFWSLSVEEQFYAFWPVLILGVVAIPLRRRWSATATLRLVVGCLLTLTVASLAYSVYATGNTPAQAYFVTPTRVWELAVGGVLASWLSRRALGRERVSEAVDPPRLRPPLAWAGLLLVAYAAFFYSGSTPFPGWQALVPVLGTAAVIAAHPTNAERGSPGGILAQRPVQWLGDVSYSVYLWHWPLIVLAPYVSGGRLGVLDMVSITIATLALAALTKRLVEDRFRGTEWGSPLRRPFLLAALGMALLLLISGMQLTEVRVREARAEDQLRKALAHPEPCFGAAALEPESGCDFATASGPVIPTPAQATRDKSDAYPDVSGGRDCWASLPDYAVRRCLFGDRSGEMSIALVGNSHAGQWLPALQVIAEQRGWRITTFLASRCAMATNRQQFATAEQTDACQAWGRETAERVVQERPDLVVLSNRISLSAEGEAFVASGPAYRTGYAEILRLWRRAGLRVLGIRDTPAPGRQIPDCVATHHADLLQCSGLRETWVPDEPLEQAAARFEDKVPVVDLVDHICGPRVCPAVVGKVIVYSDGSHLTATYARTLAPYLVAPLLRALDDR